MTQGITDQPDEFHPHGTELAGYLIDSLVGRGGTAYVYRARDRSLGRTVALKVLAPELANNDDFRQRFLRESQLAASLDHPNVLPIYEAGETDGTLYIAMRYVDGHNLRDVLADEGQLGTRRLLDIFAQVADALDAAHAHGLVHRDVKPANILLAPTSAGNHHEYVYVSDFGVTTWAALPRDGATSGASAGVLYYVAPEQVQDRPVTGRTDVYALGCVVYQCLTGTVPFPGDDRAVLLAHIDEVAPPITERRPDLRPAVQHVVATAMAKDADDRYPSCGAFLTALSRELRGAGGPTPGVPRAASAPQRPPAPVQVKPVRRTSIRRRALLAAVAGLVAVLAVVIGYRVTSENRFTGTELVPLSVSYPAHWHRAGDGMELVFSQRAADLLPLFTAPGGQQDWSRARDLLRNSPREAIGMAVWVMPAADAGPLSLERQQDALRSRLPSKLEFKDPKPSVRLGDSSAIRVDAELTDPADVNARFVLWCYAAPLLDTAQPRTVHVIFFSAQRFIQYRPFTFDRIAESVTLMQ